MKKRLIVLINFLLMVFLSGNVQAMSFDVLGGVDIHGFISQGYLLTTDNNFFAQTEDNGTVQFNEMGVNFSTDVSDKLRIGAQFFSRDLGTLSNNEVEVDWAFADYRFQDWLGLLVGKIKIPMGFYNEFRDVDSLRTPVFLPQSVYNEAWRPIFSSAQGAGLYGDIPAESAGSFNYTFMYANANMGDDNGTARTFEDQVTVWFNENMGYVPLSIDVTEFDMDYFYTGRLQWNTPLQGLRLGASFWNTKFYADYMYIQETGEVDEAVANQVLTNLAMGTPDSSIEMNVATANYVIETLVGAGQLPASTSRLPTKGTADMAEAKAFSTIFSAEYMYGDLILSAEYARVTYDFIFGSKDVPEFDSVGYYGSAAYQFTSWFQLGAYYSEYYSNDDDRDGKKRVANHTFSEGQEHRAWLKDYCLTTRFDITDNWTFKLEGHMMNGAAILMNADNPPVDDETRSTYEEDWFLFAAKASFRF